MFTIISRIFLHFFCFYDGVYATPVEVSCYSHEILELRLGKFRYWQGGDIPVERKYPIQGSYGFKDGILYLFNDGIENKQRKVHKIEGNIVLLFRYKSTEKLSFKDAAERNPETILIKTNIATIESPTGFIFPAMKKLRLSPRVRGCVESINGQAD